MSDDYRQSHLGVDHASSYVSTYTHGYYAGQWQAVESPLIEELFVELRAKGVEDVVDFAAGTGRITALASRIFPRVTAVDISRDMLAHAPAGDNVRRICRDITVEPIEEQFDLCTAFRFFLNAEPRLRAAALDAIGRMVKPGGYLLANIHMISSSPMGMVYRTLDSVGLRAHQVLPAATFRDLLGSHGFEVVKEIPYGFLPRPGPLLPSLMQSLSGPVEKAARRLSIPKGLAQSRLFLARKQ
jgi:SAM-dependent methyltransferase